MKLNHVSVVCSSRENADRFYKEIIGLKEIKSALLDRELAGQIFDIACESQLILYANDDFTVEVFVPSSAFEKVNTFVHLCLEVEDREEFAVKCQAMGVVVKKIPKGDSELIFIEDYDGNLFEIKESSI